MPRHPAGPLAPVYVAEHVVQYEGSTVVGVFVSLDAAIYGMSTQFTEWDKTERPFEVTNERDGVPVRWEAVLDDSLGFVTLRLTRCPVQTALTDLFEVWMHGPVYNGEVADVVVRDADSLTDRAHAEALAEEWNETRSDEGTFYVKQVTYPSP